MLGLNNLSTNTLIAARIATLPVHHLITSPPHPQGSKEQEKKDINNGIRKYTLSTSVPTAVNRRPPPPPPQRKHQLFKHTLNPLNQRPKQRRPHQTPRQNPTRSHTHPQLLHRLRNRQPRHGPKPLSPRTRPTYNGNRDAGGKGKVPPAPSTRRTTKPKPNPRYDRRRLTGTFPTKSPVLLLLQGIDGLWKRNPGE